MPRSSVPTLLVAFALALQLATAALVHDATVVTDLRVVHGATDAAARDACAALCPCRDALTTHVTTNWFAIGTNLHTAASNETLESSESDDAVALLCMRQDRRAPLARNAASLFALQSISVVENARACPSSMTLLLTPREGVVVCMQPVAMAHALATGSYISDVDVDVDVAPATTSVDVGSVANTSTTTTNTSKSGDGWVRVGTSVHTSASDSAPPVFVRFKRPVRPIVDARYLSNVDATTSSATACWRQLNVSWEPAGDGYVVDDADASKRTVLCLQRAYLASDTEDSANDMSSLRVLTAMDIVLPSTACGPDFQEQHAISSTKTACFKYEDSASTTRFLSHVTMITTSGTNGTPLVPGLSLASTLDLNDARSGLGTYVMTQEAASPTSARRLRQAVATAAATPTPTPTPPTAKPLAAKPSLRARYIDTDTTNPKLAFKILQVSDLHLTGDPDRYCLNPPREHASCGLQCSENLTVAFLHDLLDIEKPDLVMFSGDTLTVREWELKDAALNAALAPVEARGVPYAWVMGNHDDDYVYSRSEIMTKLAARELAYVESGPATVPGVGNYVLDIQAPLVADTDDNGNATDDRNLVVGGENATVFRIYCLDSNKNRNATLFPRISSRYDWIRKEQIAFYQELSEQNRIADEAVAIGRSVPAIMFFHIPIPEYSSLAALLLRHGERHEKTEGPDYNSGLLTALAERGEVHATFVGHDHNNEYCYKTKGVQLCYGGGAGFAQAYGSASVARRARVIEWTMDLTTQQRHLRSWKRHFGRDFKTRQSEEELYRDA